MVFAKLLSSVLLAIQLSSQVSGSPTGLAFQDAVLRQDNTVAGVPRFFHPMPDYETYGDGYELPDGVARSTKEESAASFVQHKVGIDVAELEHHSAYSSDVVDLVYLHQVHNGIPFKNAVGNVALKDGKVVAFGSSFGKFDKIADSTPSVEEASAIRAAETSLNATYTGIPTTLDYLVQSSGEVKLVRSVQVKNTDNLVWGDAHVDAHSGEVLSVASYIAHASYTAVPIYKQSIGDGASVLANPQDPHASPNGWHSFAGNTYTSSFGNNVWAYVGSPNSGGTAQTSPSLNFNYNWDSRTSPTNSYNPRAATVNAFYVANSMHDILYRYGFTEQAHNFQYENYNKGGKASDQVMISVQDQTDHDNAFFGTPPDGQSGQMSLHLFYKTNPARDSAMDNGIMVHEYGHGITNRLVGGGTSYCLDQLEGGGMGEGWGDILSDWTEQTSSPIRDFVSGTYTLNRPGGIRHYPYSTNAGVNPLKFSSLTGVNEVHDFGEVWANALHNVLSDLVQVRGFAADAYTNPDAGKGNTIFLRLLVDALALTPCSPSVLAARNAWIQADSNRYRGANTCIIWKAFARKGFGVDAASSNGRYTDGYKVPSGC